MSDKDLKHVIQVSLCVGSLASVVERTQTNLTDYLVEEFAKASEGQDDKTVKVLHDLINKITGAE